MYTLDPFDRLVLYIHVFFYKLSLHFFCQLIRNGYNAHKHNGFLVEQRLWREQCVRQEAERKLNQEAFRRLQVIEVDKETENGTVFIEVVLEVPVWVKYMTMSLTTTKALKKGCAIL